MADDGLFAVAAVASAGSHRLRQFGNLVHVAADVTVDVPREVVGQMVAIAQRELPTVVFHLAGINPLAIALTHGSNTVHEEQNVGGLLVKPVEAAVDVAAQKGEVQTNVVLGAGLPFDVVVTALVAHVAVGQVVAAVAAGNVV